MVLLFGETLNLQRDFAGILAGLYGGDLIIRRDHARVYGNIGLFGASKMHG